MNNKKRKNRGLESFLWEGEEPGTAALSLEDEAGDGRKSRSQKKRDSTALQKEGEALAAMSPPQRAELNLPEDLEEALVEYAALKTHEARRRQMQYIGRLMREWKG